MFGDHCSCRGDRFDENIRIRFLDQSEIQEGEILRFMGDSTGIDSVSH